MEVEYKDTVADVKEFLVSIGEDPSDYTNNQLQHMLEEGF